MITDTNLADMRAASMHRRKNHLPWSLEEIRVFLIALSDLLDKNARDQNDPIITQATSMIARASLSMFRCGIAEGKGDA